MGTSTDLLRCRQLGWTQNAVSRAGHKSLTPTKARQLVLDHISNSGGSISHRFRWRAARHRRRRHGKLFARSVASSKKSENRGLAQALKSHGLEALVGTSAQETLLGILGLCGGREGSHDSVDARNALSQTMDDLRKDVTTAEEVEAVLTAFTDAGRPAALMVMFFGNYVYEQFCRVFFAQCPEARRTPCRNHFWGRLPTISAPG